MKINAEIVDNIIERIIERLKTEESKAHRNAFDLRETDYDKACIESGKAQAFWQARLIILEEKDKK